MPDTLLPLDPEFDADFGAGAHRELCELVVDTIGTALLLAQFEPEPFDLDLDLDLAPWFDPFDPVDYHIDLLHLDLH